MIRRVAGSPWSSFGVSTSAKAFHTTQTRKQSSGKGRTGTMLAAQLIWRGTDAKAAVLEACERNSMWIESDSQYDWLMEFGEHCKNRQARANKYVCALLPKARRPSRGV